jgi:MoaA/NifB/PqqE/SkfB family radical SAM enzyme
VDEVLISFDYPDERHDDFRRIPGLFGKIRSLVAGLEPADRQRVVLTTVLQSGNFAEAPEIARRALDWGVNVNFSAYTTLRTNDDGLLVPRERMGEFRQTIETLLAFKRAYGNVLTSDWVLRGMVRFFEAREIPGCRAGERMLVVNPDGTLSPCGLRVTAFTSHADLKREFTARNECGLCYTSTRGNSERPARYIFLDHLGYLARRNGH